MRTPRLEIVRFFAALMIVLMAGCGKETVNIPDTTPPQVSSTTPVQGATTVALNTTITATFSKPMNPSTINATSFVVAGPGGASVAGTVTYAAAGSVATFTPAASLAYGVMYTATITAAATDQASPANPLAANYVWTFTSVTAPAPPTVISTAPVNGATSVPVNQTLSATFSVGMNSATIDAATFTVNGPGGVAVAGTVGYTASGSVATFTPAANLAYSTLYTATITTGATNSAGTPLAASYAWSFTTITPPPTVASSVPVNGATGVLPTQVLSAIFNEAMNCATLLSPATTFNVTGPGGAAVAGAVVCAGNVATFTPTAALANNSTYTATITSAAKSPAGTALASNYVWTFKTGTATAAPTVISTVPANQATGVPTNQAISAVFSEAMSSSTINAATFTLAAPGGAAVTGVVKYIAAGSIATFTPAAALSPNLVYTATITTAAQDLLARGLAANYVWTFTAAAGPDLTPPTVISTIPANTATNVPTNQAVTATFSEALNPATLTAASYTLQGPGGAAVAGLVTYAAIGDTATFTPTATLAPNTLFTATLTTMITDLAGNALAANYVWSFTTGAGPDTTPPEIVSTSPANAATDVPINQAVSATFSEAMNPLTITTATFGLTGPGGVMVTGTVTYDAVNFIATFTPTASLAGNSVYTATVTDGATDLAGNPLGTTGAPNPWSFTTGVVAVPPPVNLGTAALFGGFSGGAGMTNQGTNTVINGNIGTTGVSTLITGFHDNGPNCIYTETPLNIGLVNGAIDTAAPPPTVGCPTEGTAVTAAIAAQAAADALTAYNALVAFPNGLDVSTCPGCGGGSAGELGGRTLDAGIYKAAPGTYSITLGDLTLDAQGDPNAFWVFQMATTLTVGTPTSHRNVLLVNGAQAKNVFWQVGSAATINGILGGGTMIGTIIAQAAISVSTAGVAAVTTVNGRLLVLTGPVTVVNTVVNVPAP
jgi:hypothetical protein